MKSVDEIVMLLVEVGKKQGVEQKKYVLADWNETAVSEDGSRQWRKVIGDEAVGE